MSYISPKDYENAIKVLNEMISDRDSSNYAKDAQIKALEKKVEELENELKDKK